MIHAHGWYQLKPHTWDRDSQTLAYTLQLPDQSVWQVEIRPAADGSQQLSAEIDGGTLDLSAERSAAIESRLRWMLRLDEDLTPFYNLCDLHIPLAHAAGRGAGRLLRSATLWENFGRVLMTTNTTWLLTKRMVANLVDRWGAAHLSHAEWHAFPTPQTIAGLSEDDLKSAGLGYRAGYLLHNARQIADGTLDLEVLQHSDLSDKDLRAALLKLRGVGDYVANTLVMLLGRYSFVPVDTEARAAVSKAFFDGEKVTDKQVKETLAAYAPYSALALYCLNPDG